MILKKHNLLHKISLFFITTSISLGGTSFTAFANDTYQLNLQNKPYNILSETDEKEYNLDTGFYLVDKDITINTDNNMRNALRINDKSNVCIYIQKDCTLTVFGQNFTKDSKKSGASIYIPSSSTLSIIGDGTLMAYGGDGKNEFLPSPAIGKNGCNREKTDPDKSYEGKIFFSNELTLKLYGGKYSTEGEDYKHSGKYEYIDDHLYHKKDKYTVPFNISLLGICNPYEESGKNKNLNYKLNVNILDINNNKTDNKTINDKSLNDNKIDINYILYVQDYIKQGGYDFNDVLDINLTKKVEPSHAPIPPTHSNDTSLMPTTDSTSTSSNGYLNLILIVAFLGLSASLVILIFSKFVYPNNRKNR